MEFSYGDLVQRAQLDWEMRLCAHGDDGWGLDLAQDDKAGIEEKARRLAQMVDDAACVVVGGASGLSASGGGDFYYSASPSYRELFAPFWRKYRFNGAFEGMRHRFDDPRERWGYLACFLHATLAARVRSPYLALQRLLHGRDFFVITTNQDTQFVKLLPEPQVAELQGDHRFMQCARCCCDEVWNEEERIGALYGSMRGGTMVDPDLIPRCPRCGGEMFPWVRGYGNFLTGSKYEEEYAKASRYIAKHLGDRILFLELGVGRLTPMFIQEPFWRLAAALPKASYATVNLHRPRMPRAIAGRGLMIEADIGKVLEMAADCREEKGREAC
ncbi:MAG: SIR2 family NAD-dependent protein deacylase [Succinivibrio sp.]